MRRAPTLIHVSLGLVVGFAWAIFYWAFAIPMDAAVAAIAVVPIVEEAIRFSILVWVHRTHWPVLASRERFFGAAFGLGFGLSEASLRWADALNSGASASVFSWISPISPILVHMLLSIMVWRGLMRNSPLTMASSAVVLHMAYNAYVWLVVRTIDDVETFALEYAVRTLLLIALTAVVLIAIRREPVLEREHH